MKAGIKTRLVWSYLCLIIFTVLLFELIILAALRYYYIEGVQNTLRDQGAMFTAFYEQNVLDGNWKEEAPLLLQRFHFLIDVQVQILDEKGNITADTHNSIEQNVRASKDVIQALSGETGSHSETIHNERLLSVTHPFLIDGKVYGAIRLTTSMEQIDRAFKNNMMILLSIGLFVILLAAVISLFLANTITKPVSSITKAAEQMASGDFSVRVCKKKNDELGRLGDTLNYMAEKIVKHEKLKNEFFASISHELRTPLTSVKGWAITLHSMSEDSFFRDGLEIIANESDRLSLLLGDLLDLSRLHAGKVDYQLQNLSLKKLLQQVIFQLKPRASRQDISLIEEYSNEPLIHGDPNRLKQVLINVLDNALKFTANDGKIVSSLSTSDRFAVIHISDNGAGIPEDELQYVNETFYKGKTKGAGSGLGLSISQGIIQDHRGEFAIMSEAGIGTTVEIKLPLLNRFTESKEGY